LKWDEYYKTGIEKIDAQHQKLFELITRVEQLKSPENKGDNDALIEILVKLNLYAIYHFETEENMLEENQYPASIDHKVEHRAFIEYIEIFSRNSLQQKKEATIESLSVFLKKWITNHIVTSDFDYKDYYKSEIESGSINSKMAVKPFVFPEELENL